MLSDTTLRTLKPRDTLYRIADADGLCIEVTPQGKRLWRYRYRHLGKAKIISMGGYPAVSLATARLSRDSARAMLRAGLDPSAERQSKKASSAQAADNTFEATAKEWLG